MSARGNSIKSTRENVEEFKEQKFVAQMSMNNDDQSELAIKKKKTEVMRESIRVKQMSLKIRNVESDDDSQEGENSDIEISEDEKELAREEKFVNQFERVMKGTNKKLQGELMKAKKQINIIEDDYLHEDHVKVAYDVYNMTIMANMTRDCSPLSLVFSLRQCIVVFLL